MAIVVNFTKAQELTKDRLRMQRAPLLEAQDIAYARALETNADTTAIVTEKQRLRDITDTVDSMTTLDELKSATCTEGVPQPTSVKEKTDAD